MRRYWALLCKALSELSKRGADIRADISAELLERERRLRQDLNAKADQQLRLLSRKHTVEQAAGVAPQAAGRVGQRAELHLCVGLCLPEAGGA